MNTNYEMTLPYTLMKHKQISYTYPHTSTRPNEIETKLKRNPISQ